MNAIQKAAVRAGSAATALTALGATKAFAACDITNGGLRGGADCPNPSGQTSNTDIGQLFHTVANVLIFIVGALAVIMLIIAGLRYVTSSGNSAGVEAAKNTILYAIIGIVVAASAFFLVNFVLTQLQVH